MTWSSIYVYTYLSFVYLIELLIEYFIFFIILWKYFTLVLRISIKWDTFR